MALHGFEGLLGFVAVGLQEEKQPLLIKEFSVVLDFVFVDVFVELSDFFLFVFVMLNLSVVEESTALLAFLGLLFLF
jgi:hypothetical protein